MSINEHVLISLERRHAQNIFAGTKKVELRRREMHVEPGARVWIYEKLPIGCVTGYATVQKTHSASPSWLWRNFSTCSGLDRTEFFKYFEGLEKAFALELGDAKVLRAPVSLATLREASSGFQPPQFFSRMQPEGSLLKAMCEVEQGQHRKIARNEFPVSIASVYA